MRAKLKALKGRMHDPVPDVGRWLRTVLQGYYGYYAVPRNSVALQSFRYALMRLWYQVLRRQSQKTRITWGRMLRLARFWLPTPRIVHPYPNQRLRI